MRNRSPGAQNAIFGGTSNQKPKVEPKRCKKRIFGLKNIGRIFILKHSAVQGPWSKKRVGTIVYHDITE